MHSLTIHRSRGATIGVLLGCIAAFVPVSVEAQDTDEFETVDRDDRDDRDDDFDAPSEEREPVLV